MRRVIVVGRGIFGRSVTEHLMQLGIKAATASRGGEGDLAMDVEDRHSLRHALREGDVIVDTAGPFTQRTTSLIECAIEKRCDVIDINENLGYALRVRALHPSITQARIRVLSSCSSVSVLSHALARASGLTPTGISIVLLPASAEASSSATVATALEAMSRRPRIRRGGALVRAPRWQRRRFHLPDPFGEVSGRILESADALLLTEAWPEVEEVDFWLETGMPGADVAMAVARGLRLGSSVRRLPRAPLIWAGRHVGRRHGAFAVETRDGHQVVTAMLWAPQHAHVMAVLPAALAAADLARGAAVEPGVLPPHRQVAQETLAAALERSGARYVDSEGRTKL